MFGVFYHLRLYGVNVKIPILRYIVPHSHGPLSSANMNGLSSIQLNDPITVPIYWKFGVLIYTNIK